MSTMLTTDSSRRTNPFLMVMVLITIAGALVALNRITVWIAPVVLIISLIGLGVVSVLHVSARKRDEGLKGAVDYTRLVTMPVAQYLPWLKDNVRGHDRIIEAVFSQIERDLRLAKSGRTLGAFMLAGPTGTGKTFLAQLIGQGLFPDSKPIVLRMNQYKHSDDVYTLIGPPPGMPGYEVGGALTRPVLENPYRVVILDELEKAHRDIHHCLYDVLDAASCREKSSGKVVDFSACLFFATCNAGVEMLREIRQQSKDTAAWLGRSRDALAEAGGFDKAFLARWNGIYLMDELPPIHIAEVACLQLMKYWREYGIEVAYTTPQIILEAVERNEEFRQYGVRQLGAYLQAATSDAIVKAREQGVKKVWLGVAEDRSLQISEFR